MNAQALSHAAAMRWNSVRLRVNSSTLTNGTVAGRGHAGIVQAELHDQHTRQKRGHGRGKTLETFTGGVSANAAIEYGEGIGFVLAQKAGQLFWPAVGGDRIAKTDDVHVEKTSFLTHRQQAAGGRSLREKFGFAEGLGGGTAALQTAETPLRFEMLGQVNVVLVHHPGVLTFVAIEHGDFGVDMLGDVDVQLGHEIDAGRGVHEIDFGDLPSRRP